MNARVQAYRLGHRTPDTTSSVADLGFDYSREPDTTARPEPVPVPEGVELHHVTGRAPRRAAG
ncbi:hypothetical protein AB0M20_32785 [Actinoplanes sp. NPDC051633]|uniref:hypothetical protein n=1 Tax=Actinoplanes sp. NPDC051633 TaxID=3155670 RepID=UPI0034321D53